MFPSLPSFHSSKPPPIILLQTQPIHSHSLSLSLATLLHFHSMATPGYYGYFSQAADIENDSHLAIDELLNFPKDDETLTDTFFDNMAGNSNDSSGVTAVNSCNSSVSGADPFFSTNVSCQSFADAHFSGELCVPYDDLAELEWLSNFVEDSFSSNGMQNLQIMSTVQSSTSSPQTPSNPPPPFFPSDVTVPGKARSKRSRAAPCDWSSRLLPIQKPVPKLAEISSPDGPTRKCLHCGSDKTPQWRTGPMGPKTLCNACGVRHKSGRLVPEYRPAASPTFVSAKHSNSHRKVLELRRQKEMQRQHQFVSQTSGFGDEYLIHHHSCPDYRHMI